MCAHVARGQPCEVLDIVECVDMFLRPDPRTFKAVCRLHSKCLRMCSSPTVRAQAQSPTRGRERVDLNSCTLQQLQKTSNQSVDSKQLLAACSRLQPLATWSFMECMSVSLRLVVVCHLPVAPGRCGTGTGKLDNPRNHGPRLTDNHNYNLSLETLWLVGPIK